MSQLNRVGDEVTIPLLSNIIFGEESHLFKTTFFNESFSISKISLPLIFASLFLYLRSLTSMYFLSQLGDVSLAGGSLALAFANITGYSLFSGLTTGVDIICSQAFGAKRYKLVRATMWRGIIQLLVTSLPVLFLWINVRNILGMLTQENHDLVSEAYTFLVYSTPDLFFISFLYPLRAYLQTESKTLPLSICTVISSLVHIPITLFFVSYLRWGIDGIALSCVLSDLNLMVFLVLYIVFLKEKLSDENEEEEECFEDTCESNAREWKKLLGFAIPSFVSVCSEWWYYEIMIMLSCFLLKPEDNVASMGILIQITSLVYIFPHSLSYGVSTRIGNELGFNQPKRARGVAIVGIVLSFALGILSSTFVFLVRNTWASFFTKEENIMKITTMVLPIVGVCEFWNCLQTTGCGILRGSARTWIRVVINLVAFYVIGILGGWSLAFWLGLGFKGLWFGMLAAQVTCVIGITIVTYRTNWELEATKARNLTSLDRGNNFGSGKEDLNV
ncbi:unnamed protein product [Cochlearia groenlandica]